MVDSEESQVEITVKDIDYNLLEPNKHYSFLFEDTSLAKKIQRKIFPLYQTSDFYERRRRFYSRC